MSKKNIECKIMTIDEFLNNNEFKLLKSQREYKWQKEQIEEFISDFKRSYEEYRTLKNDEKLNYNSLIGTIYTINDNGYYSIIDGQQRTISTLITIKALTEHFIGSNKKDNYYKYYFEKFLTEDKDRKDEIKYYDLVFNSKDNISSLNHERTMSNIVNNVFIVKSLLSKFIYDEDEFQNFLDFILNKINVIKIEFNDYKLAFDTFIKVNARGIELTNVELIYSYIWTLTSSGVKESTIEKFSKKFNLAKIKYFNNENKKIKTKDKEFEEAFFAAYKCFHNDEEFQIEYNPKNMFKEIVKGMDNYGAEEFLNDFLLNKWMFYIDSYYEVVNKASNKYCKARNFLIKSKRKEYIPLLGYMNYMDDEFDDFDQKLLLIDMIKLISVWTSIKDIYLKDELKETVGKFDSESLKFNQIYDLIKNVFSNNKKISKNNFKDIILENFGNNFFQYLDECIDYDFKDRKWVIKILTEFFDLYQEYIND